MHHGVRIKDARPGGRRGAVQPLHHRPLPAGQGHRPGRRGRRAAAHRDRLACRPSWTRSSAASCSWRSSARRCSKEKDAASQERLEKLEKELADLQGASRRAARRAGRPRRRPSQQIRRLREQIEQTQARRSSRPSAQYDLQPRRRAAVRQAARAGEAARRREKRSWRAAATAQRLLKEEVDEEDIAEVVSRWTGIPVSKLLEGEMQKLLHLEERAAPARHRPGRGGHGGGRRRASAPAPG